MGSLAAGIIPAAIGAVGSIAGGGGGGGKKGDDGGSVEPTEFEQLLSQIISKSYGDTSGTRGGFYKEFENLMKGNYNPTQSPLFSPLYTSGREGIEGQYNRAKEGIMSTLYRGGGRESALNELSAERAGTASQFQNKLSASIIQDMLDKAFGASVPQMSSLLSSNLGLAGTMGERQQQQMASEQASSNVKKESGGQLFGQGLSTLIQMLTQVKK